MSLELEKTHADIVQSIKETKGVHEVNDLGEFPNKYGHNVSHFGVKFRYVDKYNYTSASINVRYSEKEVFIANVGYRPFETIDDVKSIIRKHIAKF